MNTRLPQSLSLRARVPQQTLALVIHTTGRGLTAVGQRAGAFGTQAFDDACRRWYETSGTQFYGHKLIGSSGQVYTLAADDRVCLHTASLHPKYEAADWTDYAIHPTTKALVKHKRPSATVYDWWFARWGTTSNPKSFVGSLHVNARSVAVDLIPAPDGTYTEAQYAALHQIKSDYLALYPSIRHVLGHADIDPMRRGIVLGKNGGLVGSDWDPGRGFDWSRV